MLSVRTSARKMVRFFLLLEKRFATAASEERRGSSTAGEKLRARARPRPHFATAGTSARAGASSTWRARRGYLASKGGGHSHHLRLGCAAKNKRTLAAAGLSLRPGATDLTHSNRARPSEYLSAALGSQTISVWRNMAFFGNRICGPSSYDHWRKKGDPRGLVIAQEATNSGCARVTHMDRR